MWIGHHGKGAAILLAAVLGAGMVAAAPPAVATATTTPGVASITWGECPPIAGKMVRNPRQECGTLPVPLDYRRPGGRTIELAVSRISTEHPERRRGILLFNPGGPGGRGLDFPGYYAPLFPADVLDQYDLIGFDPRGIGYSTPVTCGIDLTSVVDLLLPYPAADGSIEPNIAFARQAAADCDEHSGDLLPYITTANTARDMDRIRAALGESKLSMLGLSYGTYLGAVYVSLFKERSDRIILDSAIDPNLVWHRQWTTMGEAVALRFPDLARYAAERNDTLAFGGTPEAVTQYYLDLLARLDAHPIEISGFTVTGNLIREATRSQLYEDAAFPEIASDWTFVASLLDSAEASSVEAETEDEAAGSRAAARSARPEERAEGVRKLVAKALGAGAENPLDSVPSDNSWAARYAVVCGDAAWPKDLAHYREQVAADRAAHPLTSGMPANLWPCPFWKTKPIEVPVKVTAHGPRNVLILQNRRDPATPWITGMGLRKTLAGRAALVGVDGGNHGVYGRKTCADAVANAFLATGALPSRDVFCSADPVTNIR